MKALWAIPRLHELVQDRRRALLESKSEGGPLSVLTFLTEEHQRFITTSLQDREEKEALCLHLELELLDQVDATFFAISSPHESSLKNTDRQIDELGSALVSCDPRFRRLLNDEQQDASEFLQLFLSTLFPTMNISAQDVFHVEHPDDKSGRLPDRLTSSTYFEADQDLSDLPQLLSMQIDRVIPTRLRDVSQAVVEIPIFLSLKNGRGERLADARPRYVLRAVVVHSGAHSQFGHYYTYVPNHSTLQSKSDLCSFWTRHDDRNVQTCCYYDIKSDMERNGAIALYEKIVS